VPDASELQAMLSVAERLGEELGYAPAAGDPGDRPPVEDEQLESWGPADVENAQLVARLGSALAAIAAAAAAQVDEGADESSAERVKAALARTKLVMRGELMRGNAAALREQLPGFVFLVVLPGSGMDRALELANRTRALLEDARG
jgi:hypothetical protein